MIKVNRKDLAYNIAKKYNLKKNQSEEILQSIFLHIERELREGNTVNIVGFGSFYIKTMNSRISVNPQSGERFEQEERDVVKFRLGKNLKNLKKRK
tara:strand:- start:51 stop:338 length:288 start_codon:yes stop_codon:yes gene_type:complete